MKKKMCKTFFEPFSQCSIFILYPQSRVVKFVYLHVRPKERIIIKYSFVCVPCMFQAHSHCFGARCCVYAFFRVILICCYFFFFFYLHGMYHPRNIELNPNIEEITLSHSSSNTKNNCYLCGNVVLNEISNRQLMALR